MEKITRMDAAKSQLRRYFTGKPCVRGHISERYTLNGDCIQCVSERQLETRGKIKELMAADREARAK